MPVRPNHSSTSSSDMNIGYKQVPVIIGVFLTLLVIHTAVSIQWVRLDPMAASQWGQNEIRSERFLYGSNNEDCVLVGSSMSANLNFTRDEASASLPRVVNLAYAGGSALTGMSLIEASGKTPYCVLVEANLAYKAADEEHVLEMTNPYWMSLKSHIPNFRQENQPLNMVLTLIRDFGRRISGKGNQVAVTDNEAAESLDTPSPTEVGASNELIEARLAGLAQISDDMQREGFESMIQIARRLEAAGSRVIFYEMPGESRIRQTHYYEVLHAYFSEAANAETAAGIPGFAELQQIDIGQAYTNDGIHLTEAGLNRVIPKLYDLIRGL